MLGGGEGMNMNPNKEAADFIEGMVQNAKELLKDYLMFLTEGAFIKTKGE